MKTVKEYKNEAFNYWSAKTKDERLAAACWSEPYYRVKPTDKYGLLFWDCSRIWIDRSGNIYKNKPAN